MFTVLIFLVDGHILESTFGLIICIGAVVSLVGDNILDKIKEITVGHANIKFGKQEGDDTDNIK